MLKVKRFTDKIKLDKEIDKLTKNINFKEEYAIYDTEYKNTNIDGINIEYAYYDYWSDKHKKRKELSYTVLEQNNIYYLIYATNKGLEFRTLIYQLHNWDYIKEFKIHDFYKVNYFNDILNFKVLHIDHNFYNNYNNLNDIFTGLENIQTLKDMINKKLKQIA